ncbi:MAG: alanine racemase [Pseudomonadota bacterium]
MYFTATARVDLAALRQNLAQIRKLRPGMPIMAMVKANAYGHGLLPVAEALADADSLAVARTESAAQLRDAGITQPIVLLEGVFDTVGLQAAAGLDCEVVVHTAEQLELLDQQPSASIGVVWVKLETGMHRLGFDPVELPAVLDKLAKMAQVAEVRLMTHFASADAPDGRSLRAQLSRFTACSEAFTGAVSLANSAALFQSHASLTTAQPTAQQWLRPGIALYGISPFAAKSAASLGLKPVMNFETRLIAVKTIDAGARVGYGGRFVAPQAMRIGIAAAGYGDGYPRMLPDGAPIVVDGQRCALVGRVSMDMLAIDLTAAPEATYGSIVQMWGDHLPAEEVADSLGTIGYELVTRVSERVRRDYQ